MLTSNSITLSAPAKLNLFLHITGRRESGYHELQTLFQLIDLADVLNFEVTESPRIERLGAAYGVKEHQDLVVRAALMLQEKTRTTLGARVRIDKNIPLGAGLGGGSSDAATTLLALNALWKCALSQQQLADIGLALGADVPVFVHGHSAFATGVGECLTPVQLGHRFYVLVLNPHHVSTAEIFQHPDLLRSSPEISAQAAVEGAGINVFESVVCKLYPDFINVFQDLQQWGQPRLTGTGSAIFLPMADEKAAIRAARKIKCRYNVRAVRGVDVSPTHNALGLTPDIR